MLFFLFPLHLFFFFMNWVRTLLVATFFNHTDSFSHLAHHATIMFSMSHHYCSPPLSSKALAKEDIFNSFISLILTSLPVTFCQTQDIPFIIYLSIAVIFDQHLVFFQRMEKAESSFRVNA